MAATTVGLIETILESVLDETDDPEIRFKIRTALQFFCLLREQDNVAREALADCEMDEDLRQRLRDLGYHPPDSESVSD